jgi:large subunit ribosomal protein L15
MINLSNLKPAEGSNKQNTRVGRGQGSGGGGTAKRGHKGAKSRSGYSQKRGFEGGQMPLQRRVPKFGFKNPNKVVHKAINLDTLQSLADAGVKAVDLGVLYNTGFIQKSDTVKVLGRGELTSSLEVKVNAFSKSAVEAIEKAGGSAVVDASFSPEASEGLKLDSKASSSRKEAAMETKKEKKSTPKAAATSVKEEKATSKVEAAPAKEKAAPKKKASKGGDDLKKIEGIGPKIAELLVDAGIGTFAKLSETSADDIANILAEAGSRYASHNPTTWPEQAGLAAAGKWDELNELQDRLKGGRPE